MQNHYSELYLFSRPVPETYGKQPLKGTDLDLWNSALADYERCKSYILDFETYAMSLSDPKR